jgi:hypothetical protein
LTEVLEAITAPALAPKPAGRRVLRTSGCEAREDFISADAGKGDFRT